MTRSENMRRIKSTDTSIKIKLRKALWAKGYRYRKHCKKVFGKPDICFIKNKVAVFCDSEFWHGKYYLEGKYTPKTNTEFWISKLERNMQLDKEVNEFLEQEGWKVLRFWQKDIEQNLEQCIFKITDILKSPNT